MRSTTTFILSIFLLLTTSCHNNQQPIIRTIHDTVYKYIPHRAPDSAYLGRYEGVQGPFMIPKRPGSKDSVLVTAHKWWIDSGYHKYMTTAQGYLHKKGKDGKVVDFPITIQTDNNYHGVRTDFPPSRELPIAAAPVAKKLPDSVHTPSAEVVQETKAFWKNLRRVSLPYTYMADSNMEITITDRKVSTETVHDSIYLKTMLICTTRFIDGQFPPEPLTMEETEPVD